MHGSDWAKQLVTYFRHQHLAVFSLLIAAASLCLAVMAYKSQSEFMHLQGENLHVEFTRYRLGDDAPISLIGTSVLESRWYVTIDNRSIQAPITITGYEVTRGSERGRDIVMHDEGDSFDYTPFLSIGSKQPIRFPLTIPAGSSVRLSITIPVAISEEAGRFFKHIADRVALNDAEESYSLTQLKAGNTHNLFGNDGFDMGGFSLNLPLADKDKAENPQFNLTLRTNRGYSYTASGTWYQMIILVPKDQQSPLLVMLPGQAQPIPWRPS